jgi:hypothetical protein
MTRKQHLQKLPLQKRLQAMENIRKQDSGFFLENINHNPSTIYGLLGFVYTETKQGHSYWWDIQEKYFG